MRCSSGETFEIKTEILRKPTKRNVMLHACGKIELEMELEKVIVLKLAAVSIERIRARKSSKQF